MADSITCMKCLTTGEPKLIPRGSVWVTIGLFVVFPLVLWVVVNAGGPSERADVPVPPAEEGAFAPPPPVHAPSSVSFGEGMLALAFSVGPALGYQLWRIRKRRPTCPACESKEVVPADSPRAQQIRVQADASRAVAK